MVKIVVNQIYNFRGYELSNRIVGTQTLYLNLNAEKILFIDNPTESQLSAFIDNFRSKKFCVLHSLDIDHRHYSWNENCVLDAFKIYEIEAVDK